MDDKLLAVVWMLAYNHEDYIEQAVESVMVQNTTFNYKLIIGEDYSTDTTRSICKRLQDKYPDNIDLILNETNLGHEKNGQNIYNLCLASKAKYIAMLEGDDYWTDPLKLQKQIDFLEENSEYSMSFTRFKVKHNTLPKLSDDKYGRYFKDGDAYILFDFDKFAKGWYGGAPTLVFRARLFNINLISKYRYFRDIHLFTELLKGGNGVCLNFYGSVYRIHDGGIHSSAKPLERAETASLCYKELYFKNINIPQLKIKYRYFHSSYIKELLVHKHYFTAFKQAFLFGFYMKDFDFIVSNYKRITKQMLKGRRIWMFKKIKMAFQNKPKKKEFLGSQHYWEQRYQANKNSGVGSYGRLAEFKAEVLNAFVQKNGIQSVIEFGCGDGHQLSLAHYPSYIGFDVSLKALELCKERFKNDQTKAFYSMEDEAFVNTKADLVLSLDVIYHLIEDAVFENYMNRLFKSSTTYVIIYSSNYDAHEVVHVKCRTFTNWIAAHVSNEWKLLEHIRNKYPFDSNNPDHSSMADFYIYRKKR
ncbi:glycosyltransferase [Confluentibacter flavum]|uniref:glycosyltransferase n=1 Tax=Confluentibacter flavum TaxID=1909700 RepID=UPI0013966CBA|nr:glycosyltransferase [Confluentibacter flavum]